MKNMIESKMEAVDRLSFVKRVYDKVRGYGFVDANDEQVNLCGAIAFSDFIFVTNNHFMGRIKIQDGRPADSVKYWDYTAPMELDAPMENSPATIALSPNKGDKYQEKIFYNFKSDTWEDGGDIASYSANYIKAFSQSLNVWRDNLVKLEKDVVLGKMQERFGKSETDRAKSVIVIQIQPEEKRIMYKIIPMSKKGDGDPFVFYQKIHLSAGRTVFDNYKPPAVCSLNCLYLELILQTFVEYKYIDLAYDSKKDIMRTVSGINTRTVMLKGTNDRDEKPDIRFVLAQAKSEYPHEEMDLY